jgi:two-component system KDP operon response regulator KdpE
MTSAEILVIDDEPGIRKLLEINLGSNGYKVRLAATAKEGLLAAANHPPDLILLDIGLPDKDGHQLLQELREWYSNAILMLSVRNAEDDVVRALDNGATDYLTKPFRTAELLARIRACLRRNAGDLQGSTIQADDLVIDLVGRTVLKRGELIKLTATEYNLLSLLARNLGRVLTHQHILKEVWGLSYQSETQYLRVFMATLRKKLEDDHRHPKHLLTENGIGYRFC